MTPPSDKHKNIIEYKLLKLNHKSCDINAPPGPSIQSINVTAQPSLSSSQIYPHLNFDLCINTELSSCSVNRLEGSPSIGLSLLVTDLGLAHYFWSLIWDSFSTCKNALAQYINPDSQCESPASVQTGVGGAMLDQFVSKKRIFHQSTCLRSSSFSPNLLHLYTPVI